MLIVDSLLLEIGFKNLMNTYVCVIFACLEVITI